MTHTPIPLTGIVFPADKSGPVTASEIDGSAQGVETLIDGLTEVVMLGETLGLVVDAYGPSKGLPANPRATRFVDGYLPGFASREMLRGTAVVVGVDPVTGARTGVSAADIEAALRA